MSSREAQPMRGNEPPYRGPLHVLIMGMHRSGTSALAQALRSAGMYGGELEDTHEARAENPRGFGELARIVGFNDRLLATLGSAWDCPVSVPYPLQNPPERLSHVAEGRKLIETSLGAQPSWFAKDPRFSLLLPWWRQILFDRFVAMVLMRPAQEVAWSLSVRDGFPPELGLALWMAYHRHLAAGLSGMRVALIDYVALIERPASVVPQVIDALATFGLDLPLDRKAAIASIHPVLRRATFPDSMRNGWIHESPAAIQSWATQPVDVLERFALRVPDAEGWEVALLDLQRQLRTEQSNRSGADLERTSLSTLFARTSAELAETRERLSAAERKHEALASRIEKSEEARAALLGRLTETAADREHIRDQLAATVAERDNLQTQSTGIKSELDRVRSEVERLTSERDQLRSTVNRAGDGDIPVSSVTRQVS